MKKYPIWDKQLSVSNLTNRHRNNVVVSDIAFGNAFGYSVGCKSGVRRWN